MADENTIVTLTRDEIVRRYLRDYSFRSPDADVGPGSQPYIDAQVFADQQMVAMNNAEVAGKAANIRDMRGDRLKKAGAAEGLFPLAATGATGYVAIVASTGGTAIIAGDILTDTLTSVSYKALESRTYFDGDPCAVEGVDTGQETDVAAGKTLTWSNPRFGCGPTCTVIAQADGSGLSGGHGDETDEDFIERIIERRSNPPASGNGAEYILAIEKTPGVPVEKAFAYPAIMGPGTMGLAFTVRPSSSGSRIPNNVQVAQVLAGLVLKEPGDDGPLLAFMLAQPVAVGLSIAWAKGVASWQDATPWPPVVAADPIKVDGAVARTATSFRLTTSVAATTAPQVGQTFAVFDTVVRVFRQKRVLTVAVVVAGKSWDIVCDTANGASDTTYTPAVGQMPSPWSSSLGLLVAPVVAHFLKLGPGEQKASFPDPGLRQRRQPESPSQWPSTISNRLLTPIHALSAVSDASVIAPTVPLATTVGSPGTLVYLMTLGDLAGFAQ